MKPALFVIWIICTIVWAMIVGTAVVMQPMASAKPLAAMIVWFAMTFGPALLVYWIGWMATKAKIKAT